MTAPRADTAPRHSGVSTERWIAALEARKDGLSARHAAMVDVVIEQTQAELAADVDRFLAQQTSDAVHRRFGAVEWHTTPDVREWFDRSAQKNEPPIYEIEIDRFVVTDDLIVTDGVLKMIMSGAKLVANEMTLPHDGSETDTYLVYRRYAMFIRFAAGKAAGADTYRDPPSIIKLGS
jgi:hypothetical protein